MNDPTRRTLVVDPVWDSDPDFAPIPELSCGALLDSHGTGRSWCCGFSIKRASLTVTFFLFRPFVLNLPVPPPARSEEHTSELQSQSNLVCRLLLEKKK